jgi:SAM-dependent methyltransferase
MSASSNSEIKPDYGVDAPAVLRNLLLFGGLCLVLGVFLPPVVRLGPVLLAVRPTFLWPAFFLLVEACLYLLYVKRGKFRHRDRLLALHSWRGDESVLDVGCGRGLLLAGAAKRIRALNGSGHVTGIDIWSNTDMGGNSEQATLRNLDIEGVRQLATLVSVPAQEMDFPDASFDVVVSNLCVHNISSKSTREEALRQIVRVLKPGGAALISDYKNTGEYAKVFERLGLSVSKERGGFLTTFPPLTIVIARKLL